MADLLILAHGGSWDMRFQISALAASTATAGERVDVALFFGALDAWVRGRWDELDPQPPLSAGPRGGGNEGSAPPPSPLPRPSVGSRSPSLPSRKCSPPAARRGSSAS